MPSGAGKRQYSTEFQSSVFVSSLYTNFYGNFLWRYFGLFQRSLNIRTAYVVLWGRESSIRLISVLEGGRNQLSSERFLTFLRTEITWIVCTTAVLMSFICAAAATPNTYLRRAVVPTANGACAGEVAFLVHMKR